MRGIGFIIFIIVVQIIAGYAQKRKKDAERKAREAAMARQAQAQGLGSPTSADPPTESDTSQLDLEARRKAQLEQLRQRREGRRVGIPTTAQSPRAGVAIAAEQAKRPNVVSAPSIGTSDQARSKAQQAERRAKELERQRREQQARLSAQQQELEDAASHKAYESGFHAVADERGELHSTPAARGGASQTKSTRATTATAATAGTPRLRPGTGLLQGLHDPKSLREAMILRELLDQPVSFREGQF